MLQYSATYITILKIIDTIPDSPFVTTNVFRDTLPLIVLSFYRTFLKVLGPGEVDLGMENHVAIFSGIEHITR